MSESKEQQQFDLRLPWAVQAEPVHGWCIVDANGSRVVRDIYWKEHAQSIVRAINSLQALIDEVKELRRHLQHFAPLVFNKNVIPHLPGNLEEETKEWLKGMRTENVLALAEKES